MKKMEQERGGVGVEFSQVGLVADFGNFKRCGLEYYGGFLFSGLLSHFGRSNKAANYDFDIEISNFQLGLVADFRQLQAMVFGATTGIFFYSFHIGRERSIGRSIDGATRRRTATSAFGFPGELGC